MEYVVPKYQLVKEWKGFLYTAARDSNCQFLFNEIYASSTYLAKYSLGKKKKSIILYK